MLFRMCFFCYIATLAMGGNLFHLETWKQPRKLILIPKMMVWKQMTSILNMAILVCLRQISGEVTVDKRKGDHIHHIPSR